MLFNLRGDIGHQPQAVKRFQHIVDHRLGRTFQHVDGPGPVVPLVGFARGHVDEPVGVFGAGGHRIGQVAALDIQQNDTFVIVGCLFGQLGNQVCLAYAWNP